MIDDPDYIKRRIAYVDAIQSIHPRKRTIGLFGCLIGIIVLAWSEFRDGAPRWETTAALIIIAISWALFAYVYFARTRYVRAHPFDSRS